MRTFAIKRLQDASLSAVDRIRLAREFGLSSWEEPAYVELCERDEAVTIFEARVLGLDALVQLGRIREKEQRRRGRDIDAVAQNSDNDESLSEATRILEEDPKKDPKPTEPTLHPIADLCPAGSRKKGPRSSPAGMSKGHNGQSELQADQNRTNKAKEEANKSGEL